VYLYIGPRVAGNARLQRSHCLSCHILTHAKGFDPGLRFCLELAWFSEMWLGFVACAPLSGTHDGPAALGVLARSRVAACASGKDCGFAGLKSGCGDIEDEAEAYSGRDSRHFEFYAQLRSSRDLVATGSGRQSSRGAALDLGASSNEFGKNYFSGAGPASPHLVAILPVR